MFLSLLTGKSRLLSRMGRYLMMQWKWLWRILALFGRDLDRYRWPLICMSHHATGDIYTDKAVLSPIFPILPNYPHISDLSHPNFLAHLAIETSEASTCPILSRSILRYCRHPFLCSTRQLPR
jgi:hypothetical protein